MAIEILATCKKFTCDCKFALLHATKMSHQNFSHFYMWLKFEKFNYEHNSLVQTNLWIYSQLFDDLEIQNRKHILKVFGITLTFTFSSFVKGIIFFLSPCHALGPVVGLLSTWPHIGHKPKARVVDTFWFNFLSNIVICNIDAWTKKKNITI